MLRHYIRNSINSEANVDEMLNWNTTRTLTTRTLTTRTLTTRQLKYLNPRTNSKSSFGPSRTKTYTKVYQYHVCLHYMVTYCSNYANTTRHITTGCTLDTNIQHMHDETNILPLQTYLKLHTSQIRDKSQLSATYSTLL